MPPSNDDLANRASLSASFPQTVNGTTVDATVEAFETSAGYDPPSVWYELAASIDGYELWGDASGDYNVYAELHRIVNDPPADFDDLQYVGYLGDGGTDPANKKMATIQAGEKYVLYVSNWDWDSSTGSFGIDFTRVELPPPPANDDYADYTDLGTGDTGSASGVLSTPTFEEDDSSYGSAGSWFKWSPSTTGKYVFTGIYNGYVQVWQDVDGTRANATFVGYGYGNYPDDWIRLEQGVDYRIHVANYGQAFSFTWAALELGGFFRPIHIGNPEWLPPPACVYLANHSARHDLWVAGSAYPDDWHWDAVAARRIANASTSPGSDRKGLYDPSLSPLDSARGGYEREILYCELYDGGIGNPPGSAVSRLMLIEANGEGAKVPLLELSCNQPGISCQPSFNPDGSVIVYRDPTGDTSTYDIRSINRDGTGDTSLYSGSGAATLVAYPQFSPSGDYIAFAYFNGSVWELWVMEDDGSNPTQVVSAATTGTALFSFAWMRGSDVLGYLKSSTTETTPEFRRVDYDGSNDTLLYTQPDPYFGGPIPAMRFAWVEDDSGMVYAQQDLAIGSQPKSRIQVVQADASGSDALSPTRYSWATDATYGGSRTIPAAFLDRIYWLEERDTNDAHLASVLVDGSDYRVEHDTVADGLAFKGWNGSA